MLVYAPVDIIRMEMFARVCKPLVSVGLSRVEPRYLQLGYLELLAMSNLATRDSGF